MIRKLNVAGTAGFVVLGLLHRGRPGVSRMLPFMVGPFADSRVIEAARGANLTIEAPHPHGRDALRRVVALVDWQVCEDGVADAAAAAGLLVVPRWREKRVEAPLVHVVDLHVAREAPATQLTVTPDCEFYGVTPDTTPHAGIFHARDGSVVAWTWNPEVSTAVPTGFRLLAKATPDIAARIQGRA